jgi:hypothetical protein
MFITASANAHQSEPHTPITVESLSQFWFLAIAGVAIVAYLVRLEMGVKAGTARLTELEHEIESCKARITSFDDRCILHHGTLHSIVAEEIKRNMESQQAFLSSKIDLLLEKLNARDAQIASLKEQVNRQGADIREIEGYLRRKHKESQED